MKLYITFKDPDSIWDSIDFKKDQIKNQLMNDLNLSPAGAMTEAEERMKVFDNLIRKYFEWGEYVTLELDSVNQSIRVVPNDEDVSSEH